MFLKKKIIHLVLLTSRVDCCHFAHQIVRNLCCRNCWGTCLGRLVIVVSDVPCIMEGLEFEELAAVGSPCGNSGVYLNVGLIMPMKLLT